MHTAFQGVLVMLSREDNLKGCLFAHMHGKNDPQYTQCTKISKVLWGTSSPECHTSLEITSQLSQISPRVPYQHQQMDEIPLTFFLPILSQTMPQRNPPHQRPLNTTYSGIYIYIRTHACRSQHL